jgi:hypothetical protein
MFAYASAFNQSLYLWNVSKVTSMSYMFTNATNFDQPLGSWNLNSISDMTSMLDNTKLSCVNYSNTIVDWARKLGGATPPGITFGANGLQYAPTAVSGHNALTNSKWNISGDNPGGLCSIIPLPIGLQSFTVQAQNSTALLQWTTATETGNKGFYVERSADGAAWTDLTFVNSAASGGNSSAEINYQYTDNNPLAGYNYYRLKQVDLTGAASYSAVQGINFSNLATAMQVLPNPASRYIKISNLPANATVRIVSINGSVYTLPVSNGDIDVSRLSAGVYFAQVIVSNSITGTLKFVKE